MVALNFDIAGKASGFEVAETIDSRSSEQLQIQSGVAVGMIGMPAEHFLI
jgi:hypothetical protein